MRAKLHLCSLKTMLTRISAITLTSMIVSCTVIGAKQLDKQFGPTRDISRYVSTDSMAGTFFRDNVKPILENRCVNCHACYDSPCQLQLSSSAGIDRGIHESPVYSSTRIVAANPTRLFIDKQSTKAWREIGFNPVLNERRQIKDANLSAGLLFQALLLKQKNPLPETNILSKKDFDFSLNRDNECPSIETFHQYSKKNPLAGMPYGLPGLSNKEFLTIQQWIQSGGKLTAPQTVPEQLTHQIKQWELFLNNSSLKSQLVSRYIYEHLFLANIFFGAPDTNDSQTQYFKLVRSYTPPGQPLEIIATRRPYDDPETSRAYYRFRPLVSTLVAKTHIPYALNSQRMQWIKALFFEPDYEVTELPGYEKRYINPFITFKDLPSRSRYRFMLEESNFIISGFIKGPVCRGQVAVDVINDHFWAFFIDPDTQAIPRMDEFLLEQSENLRLPGHSGSTAGILTPWLTYSKANRKYLAAKRKALKQVFQDNTELNETLIWDGDGKNENAALTIFRNFDNASVVKGLVGNTPKTVWVIDYPLLERIHYLLTVDFDVYGNLGHQLNTRLYMDFLRIEGEYNFLLLMPFEKRLSIRDHWYRDTSESVRDYLYSCDADLVKKPSISYMTNDPKTELLQLLKARLSGSLSSKYSIFNAPLQKDSLAHLGSIEQVKGTASSLLPEISHLVITTSTGEEVIFTLLANRAHSNITSLLREETTRLPEEDTITLAYGVIGNYPNAFFNVNEEDLVSFSSQLSKLRNEKDYRQFKDQFGIRRTNPDFWRHSDKVHEIFKQQQPTAAAVLDYNRLENR